MITFKQFLNEGKKRAVPDHVYSVKVLSQGKDKKWPTLKGEIYEKDVMIGTFTRGAVRDSFVPPIESKFRTSAAKARFDDFADSLSIEETIEALLPRSVFEASFNDDDWYLVDRDSKKVLKHLGAPQGRDPKDYIKDADKQEVLKGMKAKMQGYVL